MANWEVIKIPKRGYGATKEYRWNHMWVQKGEGSDEGWYILDDKWDVEYNQGGYGFVDASEYLVGASHIIDFKTDDGRKFRVAVAKTLIDVAKSNEKEWVKAKKPVYDRWIEKERVPADEWVMEKVLFKKGNHDYGFKRAKDALKMAEMLAQWREDWIGLGILNHKSF